MPTVRRDSHAGSWYVKNPSILDQQLSEWLSAAHCNRIHSRAIISPHAGYTYSGRCAAFAFKQIDPAQVKRVFILGPSHHMNINEKCALSGADQFATPFYHLEVDKETCQKLHESGEFAVIPLQNDEDEHSLEMQLPYLAKVMEKHRDDFKIVPVVVGSLSSTREALYGQIFAPYLADPQNLFIISSDFCHWGQRFHYTYYDERKGSIWESIQALDEEGMELIVRLAPDEFTNYLRTKRNTICGRHPIGVFLRALRTLQQQQPGLQADIEFLQYAQSERCLSMHDSSVSYAAASLILR